MDNPLDPASSVSELTDTLMLMEEQACDSRVKMLRLISSRSSLSIADLRFLDKALTTCWDERRYTGLALLEWRTAILEAAERLTRIAKKTPETFLWFVELAVKASKWCSQTASTDTRQAAPGKSEGAVIRLIAAVFEGTIEVNSSGCLPLFEQPCLSSLETLILSSFELVKAIYIDIAEKPSQPAAEPMKKACHELLHLTFRVSHVVRRQIDNSASTATNEGCLSSSQQCMPPISIRIVAASITNFMQLGKLATAGDGISLGLLSLSWKSITALLQAEEGRTVVAAAVDIVVIMTTLFFNALREFKRALQIWFRESSHSRKEDGRKQCVLVKFFLVTALKISTFYPLQAIMTRSYLITCVSKFYAFLVQKDIGNVHKDAKDALAEVVIPTAFSLVHDLLLLDCVDTDQKVQLLRDIYRDTDELENRHSIGDDPCDFQITDDVLGELFGNKPMLCSGTGLLKAGKVVLFLSILKASCFYSPSLLCELVRGLPWLLGNFLEEGLYTLMTQSIYLPVTLDRSQGWGYRLLFPYVSSTMKCFAIIAAKHDEVWAELKYFLFEHALHPCVICGELVLDVWSFIVRQGDSDLAQIHVESLFYLLQQSCAAKAERHLQQRLARVLCALLRVAPDSAAELVYHVVFEYPFTSSARADTTTMLVLEGFPFNQRGYENLLSNCISYVKGSCQSVRHHVRSKLDIQKPALICLVLLLRQSGPWEENIKDSYLNAIKEIAEYLMTTYSVDHDSALAFHTLGTIGPTLDLIPHVQDRLNPKTFESFLPRLLELCHILQSKDMKYNLAEFLANLGHMRFPEVASNPAVKALWGLYHVVLTEKHWALIHVGLESFAQFAARASFQQLWRFVPPDAAAASDSEPGDDQFMNALRIFIERQPALTSLNTHEEELEVLRAECVLQQQTLKSTLDHVRKLNGVQEETGVHLLGRARNKPARSSSEIQEAVAMLNKGIGVLTDKVPDLLHGETSNKLDVLRAQLAELNAEVVALQRGPGC